MGFISPVKAINDLHFQPMPDGLLEDVKAIRVAGDVFLLGKDGKLYNDRWSKYSFSFTSGRIGQKAVLLALVKLGVLSRKDVNTHCKLSKEANDRNTRRDAIAHFVESAKKAGVTLTKKQLRAFKDNTL